MEKRTQRDLSEQHNTPSPKRQALDVIRLRAQTSSQEQMSQQDQEVLDHALEVTKHSSLQEIQEQLIKDLGDRIIDVTKKGGRLQGVTLSKEQCQQVTAYIKKCLAYEPDICKKALTKVENASVSHKEAIRRYGSSERGKEARRRYQESLDDPVALQRLLPKRMQRTEKQYLSRINQLQEKMNQFPDSPELHTQRQELLQEWSNAQQGHRKDLEKAIQDAQRVADIEKEVRALLHSAQDHMHQQEQLSAGVSFEDLQARDSYTTLQGTRRFEEIYDELHNLLQAPDCASQLGDLEKLGAEYDTLQTHLDAYIGEDLEILVAGLANPEHFEQGSRLDF